jgi:hypothetical protein
MRSDDLWSQRSVLSASKQHWPTVQCLQGTVPNVMLVSETPVARPQQLDSDHYKFVTAHFNVWSSNGEMTTVLHSYTRDVARDH